MSNLAIVGTQWGDEGKGKIVDLVTKYFDIIVRYQGGHNAGHTVRVGSSQHILHLIPSGILHRDKVCVIGNGVVVDPLALVEEMEALSSYGLAGRFFVSNRAHLIMPYHRALEEAEEARLAADKIGTTQRGIGPCYEDKMARRGIRLCDLEDPEFFRSRLVAMLDIKNEILGKVYGLEPLPAEPIFETYLGIRDKILPFVTDTAEFLNKESALGRSILFEGAQGTLLDVDHGTYPYVTSSNAAAGGACTGAGVGPTFLDGVIGIAKAYTTRVGGGPFPTELSDSVGEKIQKVGAEFGASTGRPRRCGWFDAVVVRYAALLNGLDSLVITKLDVLDQLPEIKICVGYRFQGEKLEYFPTDLRILDAVEPVYETHLGWQQDTGSIRSYQDLPERAKSYLNRLSELVQTEISIISLGPERRETVFLEGEEALVKWFGSAGKVYSLGS